MESPLLSTARELVALLNRIRDDQFQSEADIQQAKALNFSLGPVYSHIYGATPLISTDYPERIWWPRAYEHATQALASLEGGGVDFAATTKADEPLQRRSGGQIGPRLTALHRTVERFLENTKHHIFDPDEVENLFERFASDADALRSQEAFSDLPRRGMPKRSETSEYFGRGYIDRRPLELLRTDIEYCLTLISELGYTAAKESSVDLRREGLFVAGTSFDALMLMHSIVADAASSIALIDGYLGKSTLELLAAKRETVEVRILTKAVSADVQVLAAAYNMQHGGLEIRTSDAFHDRFLIVDQSAHYHVGASLKDAGRRGFMFSLIEEPTVIRQLAEAFEQAWASGTTVI